MADLTAKLNVLDKMNDSILKIALAGMLMAEQFERAEKTVCTAFDDISGTAARASSKVDGFAASIESLRGTADNAAGSADVLAGALGGCSDAAAELARNENISAGSRTELARAGAEAAEAMYDLARGQDEAAQSMEAYDAVTASASASLTKLEAAAKNAGRAVEKTAGISDKVASANKRMSDGVESGGQKGIEAIKGVADELEKAGITAKVEEIAEAVYELVTAFSEAESTVVKATGAGGEILDGLTDSMMDAYAASKSGSLADTAAAVGEINTRMALTGDRLTTVTGQFLDFSEITGTNVVGSVQKATKIMNKWGIEQSEVESVLDRLAYAGQISGASVDNLSSTLIRNSAVFQALGMNLDNAIGLLADLEIYGITAQTAVTGLRTAVDNFTRDGLDAKTALHDVIDEIANMEDANGAAALAGETFGNMVKRDFIDAIRSGAISVDSLSQSLDGAQGTLTVTAETAQTLDQKWTQVGSNISTAFTKAVQPTIDSVSSGLTDVANSFGDFLNEHPMFAERIALIGAGLGSLVIAFAAVSAAAGIYKTVMLISEAVTMAFGVSLSAAIWPITLIVAGIAAVVAIVAKLIDHFSAAEDETAGMTAATRAQYYELQDLNAEYKEACEEYGETSEEALRLKYQVDDLSSAFEADRQTVEEFSAEVDALCESVSQITSDFNDSMMAIKNTEIGALALIQKYEDLSSQASLTGAQQKELEAVAEKLSKTYPDLAEQMDGVTLSTEDYVEAMKKACRQQAEQQRQAQAQKTYVEALQKQAELEDEIAKAEADLNAEREAHGIYYDEQMQIWCNGWYTEDSLLASWTTDLDEYNEKLEELKAAQAENDATILRIEQGWADIAAAEQAAAEETMSWQDAATVAYENVKDRVIKLCEAYGEAYNAAMESFERQFGLFDKADMKSENYMKSTVENAQKALDSQLSYWDSYLANIEVLKNTSAEDLGITQENYEALMAYAQGGSEQAAGLAASMTEALGSGNTEAVAALANTMSEVNARKQEMAAFTADWITDFSSQMDEIEEEMKLDTEAAASAEATINAYADSIRVGKANAVSAAEEVADAVMAAFRSAKASVNVSVNSGETSGRANETANAEGLYPAEEREPEPATGPAAVYTDGAAESTTEGMGSSTAGENGFKLSVGEPGRPTFPIVKTDGAIFAMNENREQLQVFPAFGEESYPAYGGGGFPALGEGVVPVYGGGAFPALGEGSLPALSEGPYPALDKGGRGEKDKNVFIHIDGSGPIEVTGGKADKEAIVEVLGRHLKPILMNMIQGEIYEEGEYSYEY